VPHRWITEQRFLDRLALFVSEYNRGGFPEPIPLPDRERAAAAASAIVAINEPVFGRQRYRSLNTKCAAAFYELCKRHFFVNGNKRIATYFLLHLLEIHEWMLSVRPQTLADFAERVSASDPSDRDIRLREIAAFIRRHVAPLEEWHLFHGRSRSHRRSS